MNIQILGRGAFGSALVHLKSGESFCSESGAMYRASANIDINVTTRSRSSGGLLAGVKRLFAGENFFFSTYSTNDGREGEVGLRWRTAPSWRAASAARNTCTAHRRERPCCERS